MQGELLNQRLAECRLIQRFIRPECTIKVLIDVVTEVHRETLVISIVISSGVTSNQREAHHWACCSIAQR